jgi:hypothetical protein
LDFSSWRTQHQNPTERKVHPVACNTMTVPQTKQIINLLKNKGVVFHDGLSGSELLDIEKKFLVKFPPDLKQFLQTQLPISHHFINWRQGLHDKKTEADIVDIIDWPLEGILWDIKNGSWLSIWGDKPENKEDQIAFARSCFARVPKMIPIYGHRYIPSEPNEVGNPIFSVHQTDIIYYGYDLATYLSHEFNFNLNTSFQELEKPKKEIRFWTWCVEHTHP